MEATVKSMTKSSRHDEVEDLLTMINYVGQCCNAETLLQAKMVFPAQKLHGDPIQDIIPAYHRSFAEEEQLKAEAAEQQVNSSYFTVL